MAVKPMKLPVTPSTPCLEVSDMITAVPGLQTVSEKGFQPNDDVFVALERVAMMEERSQTASLGHYRDSARLRCILRIVWFICRSFYQMARST